MQLGKMSDEDSDNDKSTNNKDLAKKSGFKGNISPLKKGKLSYPKYPIRSIFEPSNVCQL